MDEKFRSFMRGLTGAPLPGALRGDGKGSASFSGEVSYLRTRSSILGTATAPGFCGKAGGAAGAANEVRETVWASA
eukprot:scaffold78982_cov26-Tisochrysis_lutea.AAC.6